MLGVHMFGVGILHLLCVIRVKVGDVGDAERELLGRARALVLELMHWLTVTTGDRFMKARICVHAAPARTSSMI